MKHIIIIIILSVAPFFSFGNELPSDYEYVCERVTGCAVYSNAKTPKEYCPTCTKIKKIVKKIPNKIIKYREKLNLNWVKSPEDRDHWVEENGWEWNGPIYRGLWRGRSY